MATATKSLSEKTSTKTQYTLLLFLVLLLISPLFARPIYFSSSYRQLFSSSSPSAQQSTATNLHPFSTSSTPATTHTHTTATTKGQFKAAAHEVPSGPNPESNKSVIFVLDSGSGFLPLLLF
ncbi:hypothetical protein REPUB_Repub20aG0062600 [Reevesia pubescens]